MQRAGGVSLSGEDRTHPPLQLQSLVSTRMQTTQEAGHVPPLVRVTAAFRSLGEGGNGESGLGKSLLAQ